MRAWISASALALGLLLGGPATAGVYGDELSKCVVESSTDQDRAKLVQWMFAALSVHPQVQSLSNVTDAQRADYSKSGADLMQDLLLKRCRKQAVSALKYEGETALLNAFRVFGEVATRTLMTDPKVGAELQRLDQYTDKASWEALIKEAGVFVPAAPAKQ